MGMEALSELEVRVFNFIKDNDFVKLPWSTPEAARVLNASETEIYEALSHLQKELKTRFLIYYHDGALRVRAE